MNTESVQGLSIGLKFHVLRYLCHTSFTTLYPATELPVLCICIVLPYWRNKVDIIQHSLVGIFWPTLSTKLKSPCSFRPNGSGDNVERMRDAKCSRGHNAEDDVAGPRSAEPRRRPVLSTARTPITGIAEPQTTPEQMHKSNKQLLVLGHLSHNK